MTRGNPDPRLDSANLKNRQDRCRSSRCLHQIQSRGDHIWNGRDRPDLFAVSVGTTVVNDFDGIGLRTFSSIINSQFKLKRLIGPSGRVLEGWQLAVRVQQINNWTGDLPPVAAAWPGVLHLICDRNR